MHIQAPPTALGGSYVKQTNTNVIGPVVLFTVATKPIKMSHSGGEESKIHNRKMFKL